MEVKSRLKRNLNLKAIKLIFLDDFQRVKQKQE